MSSTTSRRTHPMSSFESTYVSLDLLSFVKSGQTTPFQIFNEVVMPDFRKHLLKGNHQKTANEDDDDNADEEDSSHCNNLSTYEEIQNDIDVIEKACGRLERWEADVNDAIKELVLQSLDDAFKERMQTLENTVKTHFMQSKLLRTRDIVSRLKERIFRSPKLSLDNLDSESFKRSRFSMGRDIGTVDCQIQLPEVNISKEMAEISTLEDIRAVYDGLSPTAKVCLLCFSVFPENAVIKKKVLVHWWVGEGFIDSCSCEEEEKNSMEETAKGIFKEFMAKGLIEPVFKKQRASPDSCKMQPSIRFAVIKLAHRAGFTKFDADGNPTTNFSDFQLVCLTKSEEGSSVRELRFGFQSKEETVRTVFNVSERLLAFGPRWFSKMKHLKVLQLGRWESSAKHLIELHDSEFLKGLKKMKHLRYLSLRGVSGITELPDSICKLENLRILNLNGCHNLQKLPDGIGSLKKLTHLDMYECYLISDVPKGLALLSELQVLKGFVIGKPRPGGQYCQLEDLTNLEKLKRLSIHVDRNSKTVHTELSSLEKFEKLKSLSISWSRIYDSSIPQKGLQRMVTKTRRLASNMRSRKQFTEIGPIVCSLPSPLEKLDLHYFPDSNICDWFLLRQPEKLRKLYISGGELSHLKADWAWQAVEALRLKFLRELRMDWRELKQLFPKLSYVEKCQCPKLCFFPCDQSGVWKNKLALLDH